MAWVAVAAAATTVVGNKVLGPKQSGSVTSTNENKLDPRADKMLWGENGSGGLLSQYQGMMNQPQSAALQGYGQTAGDYLSNYGASDMGAIRNTANGLMGNENAPLIGGASTSLPAYADPNHVNAPSQNGMDLSGSYDRFINGTPGANPYLDKSIQGAIDQNRLGFQQLQSDATDNLQKNILPGIRSNSVLAGQYGGSRQGVAEGNAIGDFGKAMASAANQFGQNATNAAVGAKANAYETDSNRALNATQGLGAQQYGVASQNANADQASQFLNVNNLYDATKTNSAFAQQANLANQQAQLSTVGQNNSAALGGAGLLSGLSGNAYGAAQNADNAQINRATQVNGLLAPYLTSGQSQTNSQPLYQNQAGNALGGAMMGGQLAGMFGGGKTSTGATQGSIFDLFGKSFGNYGA